MSGPLVAWRRNPMLLTLPLQCLNVPALGFHDVDEGAHVAERIENRTVRSSRVVLVIEGCVQRFFERHPHDRFLRV